MKRINLNSILIVIIFMVMIILISINHKNMKKQIAGLNREKVIHTYIPSEADCAIKLMHLRDISGDTFAVDRMICHWSQL